MSHMSFDPEDTTITLQDIIDVTIARMQDNERKYKVTPQATPIPATAQTDVKSAGSAA